MFRGWCGASAARLCRLYCARNGPACRALGAAAGCSAYTSVSLASSRQWAGKLLTVYCVRHNKHATKLRGLYHTAGESCRLNTNIQDMRSSHSVNASRHL